MAARDRGMGNTEEYSSRERDAETRAACRKDMQRPRKGRATAEQRAVWGWNESSEECGVEGWLSQPEQEWLEKQIQIQEAARDKQRPKYVDSSVLGWEAIDEVA